MFESERAIGERAEAVVVELVDTSGEDDFASQLGEVATVGKEVAAGTDFDIAEERVDQTVVTADGDALVCVVKVIVVKCEA